MALESKLITLGGLQTYKQSLEEYITEKYIPYDLWNPEDKTYLIANKCLSVSDTIDSNSIARLSGQNLSISHGDGKRASFVNYDNIATISANGNFNDGSATIMNMISLEPDISGDVQGVSVTTHIDGTTIRSKLQNLQLEFDTNWNAEGETKAGKIQIGYTNLNSNVFNNGDLYFSITDPNTQVVSLYALKNDKLNNGDSPKYLATEDYVDSKLNGINNILENILND